MGKVRVGQGAGTTLGAKAARQAKRKRPKTYFEKDSCLCHCRLNLSMYVHVCHCLSVELMLVRTPEAACAVAKTFPRAQPTQHSSARASSRFGCPPGTGRASVDMVAPDDASYRHPSCGHRCSEMFRGLYSMLVLGF